MAYSQVKSGSSGSDVKKLQELLKASGYNISVDGIYGSQTQNAVTQYQKSNKLAVDGIVGNQTWGALTTPKKTTPTAAKPTTPNTPTAGASTNPNQTPHISGLTLVEKRAAKKNQPAQQPISAPAYAPAPMYGEKPTYTPDSSLSGAADMLSQYEQNKPGEYEQSEAVQQAYAMLQQQEMNKPGAYQSSYAAQIQQLLDQAMNRPDFNYNMNADPLFNQYKDQYTNLGKNAMQDTMGNAAALTGGYGSSYASTAGNQAYQGYLGQLNNIVPQLENQAYGKYQDEGADMYNQLGTVQNLDTQAYGQYRDTTGDYYNDLSIATDKYNNMATQDYGIHRDEVTDYYDDLVYYRDKYQTMTDQDYNRYLNDLNSWATDREFMYAQQQDEQAQSNFETQFEYGQQQDTQAQGDADRAFTYAQQQDTQSQSNFNKQFNYGQQQDTQSQSNYKQENAQNQANLDREYALRQLQGQGGDSTSIQPYQEEIKLMRDQGKSGADIGNYIASQNLDADTMEYLMNLYGVYDEWYKSMYGGGGSGSTTPKVAPTKQANSMGFKDKRYQ